MSDLTRGRTSVTLGVFSQGDERAALANIVCESRNGVHVGTNIRVVPEITGKKGEATISQLLDRTFAHAWSEGHNTRLDIMVGSAMFQEAHIKGLIEARRLVNVTEEGKLPSFVEQGN